MFNNNNIKIQPAKVIVDKQCYLFKKLLFTMENATTAGSSQSNVSRLYIWKANRINSFWVVKSKNVDDELSQIFLNLSCEKIIKTFGKQKSEKAFFKQPT